MSSCAVLYNYFVDECYISTETLIRENNALYNCSMNKKSQIKSLLHTFIDNMYTNSNVDTTLQHFLQSVSILKLYIVSSLFTRERLNI